MDNKFFNSRANGFRVFDGATSYIIFNTKTYRNIAANGTLDIADVDLGDADKNGIIFFASEEIAGLTIEYDSQNKCVNLVNTTSAQISVPSVVTFMARI